MKTPLRSSLITIFILLNLNLHAQQNKCSTMQILKQRILNDPSIRLRMEQSETRTQQWIHDHQGINRAHTLITIPVVVHVIYHTTAENISDAQIHSQIDVLNADFRRMNADTINTPLGFAPFAADVEIEFCLASRDINGAPTTGITRTYTDTTAFDGGGLEKHAATGGEDNWDPTQYLNLWVCNLDASGGILGYATFPSDLAASPGEDGVVIRYQAFGTGTAAPNDLGRTATHEVGHWLNLNHIWGDNDPNCGDDSVNDTPPAYQANYHCPAFPHNPNDSCGTDGNGEMFMNYMDYVDDDCMNMFTIGQSQRMQAALNGDRLDLLTSLGCANPIGVNEISFENNIKIYPNPNDGNFIINIFNEKSENINISIYDLLGNSIRQFGNVESFPFSINLGELSNGIYYFKIKNDGVVVSKKVIINKAK